MGMTGEQAYVLAKKLIEADKKIESEVATDFSQADTPQFQQTIDDVLNDVAEIKGDLEKLKQAIVSLGGTV